MSSANYELEPLVNYPSYLHMDIDQEKSMVADLLAHTPEFHLSEARFGLVLVGPDSRYANLARSIESEVFYEFFNNDSELMEREYGLYESASKFFLVIDKEDSRRAGVMRLLHDSDSGFKAVNDVQRMGLTALDSVSILDSFGIKHSKSTIEIATIAAAPDYRGSKSDQLVSASMYRALYKYCKSFGYKDLIAVIDAKPLQNLININLPVEMSSVVDSPFEYLDAKNNSLIHIPIDEIKDYMIARDPDVFDFLLGDSGMDSFCTLSLEEK